MPLKKLVVTRDLRSRNGWAPGRPPLETDLIVPFFSAIRMRPSGRKSKSVGYEKPRATVVASRFDGSPFSGVCRP